MLFKRGLTVGFVNFIFGLLLNYLTGIILPFLQKEYQNPSLFRPWSDPLMMLFFAYPFITGMMFAYLWNLIKEKIKGKNKFDKSTGFANLYFLIATIPGMFITYTTFPVSLAMVLVWAITGYVQVFIAGWILASSK